MSGILDSKSRVLDVILTAEGRRQMSEGTFKVSYLTFTDSDVAYIPDAVEGHDDPTNKIYLEACNLPQDQIVFEANDEGYLVPFRTHDIKLQTPNDNISTAEAEGTIVNGHLVTYQYYHGRRVKTYGIKGNNSDKGKGFVYSDATGLTGSILIDPISTAGSISSSFTPYISYVGTRGGMAPSQFAQAISGAIESLRLGGGPNVLTTANNGSVYMDASNGLTANLKIFTTGTLSTPLVIEQSAIGGNLLQDELKNAAFASQIEGILTSSFDNFSDLRSLSTIDRLFEDDKFEISQDKIEYNLTRINSKTQELLKSTPQLNAIDSIFSDDKMSHLENFMYLPPIIKTSDSLVPDKSKIENLTPYLLGNYPSWGENEKKLDYEGLMTQLSAYEAPSTVTFRSTSNPNKVLGQIFEVTNNSVSKLDLVDFGDMKHDSQSKRVYFAGKTFLDNRGTTCFVNMFTIIFSKIPDDQT